MFLNDIFINLKIIISLNKINLNYSNKAKNEFDEKFYQKEKFVSLFFMSLQEEFDTFQEIIKIKEPKVYNSETLNK